MTKQEALAEIAQKLVLMEQYLKEAQALADEHGLKFKASFGGSMLGEDSDGQPVRGTYYGKGQDEDIETGYWYWENSSMNC